MKLLFLSFLHGFGGAERQNVMLANALVDRGHDVTLVSMSVNNTFYDIDSRINYIYLPDRSKGILNLLSRYHDIKSLIKTIKPDLTVNFWFQPAYMTAMMSKRLTGKVIYSERGDPGDNEYSGILGMIRKVVLPRIDGFVFQSKGAQDFFENNVKKRSVVIPNPVFIHADDFPTITTRRKSIVTVGRLHPQKNQMLLINAFARIVDTFSDYKLGIYGDGDLKDELQSRIDSLEISDKAILKGTSKKIHNLIYDAALFVLSSDYEGIPNTLLEAMALGIPCISTDCRPGGARELIHSGNDGLIVPINDETALANAIKDLLSDEEKASEMGIKAKKTAQRFDPISIYSQWERFFVKILE